MIAKDLKADMVFRRVGQRKWRMAGNVFNLGPRPENDGKPVILVCLPDCSQVVFNDENETVETPAKQHDMDNYGFAKLGRRRAGEAKRRSGAFA